MEPGLHIGHHPEHLKLPRGRPIGACPMPGAVMPEEVTIGKGHRP